MGFKNLKLKKAFGFSKPLLTFSEGFFINPIYPKLMTVTVYSRIVAFYQTTEFRLHSKHKAYIGGVVSKKFVELYGPSTMWRSSVKSDEDDGTWIVYVYPDWFIQEIDKIISWYVGILKSPKRKAIIEKPASEPPKRNRIRKAVPVFSGKPLNK